MAAVNRLREIARMSMQLQRESGLVLNHILALLVLEEKELNPNRLARELRVTTGGVSTIIDRLEDLKFVRREGDLTDLRKVVVRITPAGKRYVRNLAKRIEELNK